MAFAVERARFALSEVNLGLIPATIAPYVIGRIGAVNARRYFLTGERFDATAAERAGLINGIVADSEALEVGPSRACYLPTWVPDAPSTQVLTLPPPVSTQAEAARVQAELMTAGPAAVCRSKELIDFVGSFASPSPEMLDGTAERLCDARAAPEGKEGVGAFLAKRKPAWIVA